MPPLTEDEVRRIVRQEVGDIVDEKVRRIVKDEVMITQDEVEQVVIDESVDKDEIVEEVADEVESRLH